MGLAMNLCGSDVAKDAADMIIMNDDFGSIVNAVTKKCCRIKEFRDRER